MNLDHLIDCLPQEPPFRFLDAVESHDPPKQAVASKTFKSGDAIFRGHLPGQPIVPGVIILEALAQLCGLVLLELPLDPNARIRGYLAGVSRLRYYRRVGPDETIRLTARLDRKLGSAAQFDVEADVDGEKVVRGQLTVGGMDGP